MEVGSKKSIDVTLSKIAELFYDEFHLTTPPFIALLNHKTQCFHYYGRKYYRNIIETSAKKNRVAQVIEEVRALIQDEDEDDADALGWLRDELSDKTREFLRGKSTSNSNDNIDIFVDLLLNTPISRYYGVAGQTFYTRIPRFFYTSEQFERYSGAKEYVEYDPILAGKQKLFSDIINTLENLFWKGMKIQSAIMAPIPLYGQMAGICFVADPIVPFSAYDYLRFLQLVKELGITLIKDAREYEFLSAVLSDLSSSGFNVTKSIFKKLPVLFNITGGCLKEKDTYSRLSFNKSDETKLFPTFEVTPCKQCNKFNGNYTSKTISLEEICDKHKNNNYLKQPKSGMYVYRRDDVALMLYLDFEEDILEMYIKEIELAMEDSFDLIKINDKNIEFHKGYGHDTHRLMNDIKGEKIDFIEKIIDRRTKLMVKLFGEKIEQKDGHMRSVNLCEKIEQIWGIYNSGKGQKKPIKCPNIDVPAPEYYIYWPAVECILYNLIKNTFQNYDKAKTESTEISFTKGKLEYIQKGKEFKFGVAPEKVHGYLNGEDLDWGNLTGLGHYIIQWIMDRFRGSLSIEFREGKRVTIVKKDKIEEDNYCSNESSETSVTYKIKFPWKWE